MKTILPPFQPDDAFQDTDTVCFCFGYTKGGIEQDYWNSNGHSTILERIILEKKTGGCDCAHTNPKGH